MKHCTRILTAEQACVSLFEAHISFSISSSSVYFTSSPKIQMAFFRQSHAHKLKKVVNECESNRWERKRESERARNFIVTMLTPIIIYAFGVNQFKFRLKFNKYPATSVKHIYSLHIFASYAVPPLYLVCRFSCTGTLTHSVGALMLIAVPVPVTPLSLTIMMNLN